MPEQTVTIDLTQVADQVLFIVVAEAAFALVVLLGLGWWALHRRNRDVVEAPSVAGRSLNQLHERAGYQVATALLAVRSAVTALGHCIVLMGERVSALYARVVSRSVSHGTRIG